MFNLDSALSDDPLRGWTVVDQGLVLQGVNNEGSRETFAHLR